MRQTCVGVIIWPATPKTMTMPARLRSPGAIPATIGITMAACPWLMPVRMPTTVLTAAMTTGVGRSVDWKARIISSRIPASVRTLMK